MGCITDVSIALWLISFSMGILILYKVQKENLSWLFKAAGWFIVVIALGGMLCCTFRCIGRCSGDCWHGKCEMRKSCCAGGGMMKEHCEKEKCGKYHTSACICDDSHTCKTGKCKGACHCPEKAGHTVTADTLQKP